MRPLRGRSLASLARRVGRCTAGASAGPQGGQSSPPLGHLGLCRMRPLRGRSLASLARRVGRCTAGASAGGLAPLGSSRTLPHTPTSRALARRRFSPPWVVSDSAACAHFAGGRSLRSLGGSAGARRGRLQAPKGARVRPPWVISDSAACARFAGARSLRSLGGSAGARRGRLQAPKGVRVPTLGSSRTLPHTPALRAVISGFAAGDRFAGRGAWPSSTVHSDATACTRAQVVGFAGVVRGLSLLGVRLSPRATRRRRRLRRSCVRRCRVARS